jgi:hypothetical protein
LKTPGGFFETEICNFSPLVQLNFSPVAAGLTAEKKPVSLYGLFTVIGWATARAAALSHDFPGAVDCRPASLILLLYNSCGVFFENKPGR